MNNAFGQESDRPNDLHAWMVAAIPRAVAYATGLLHDREQAEDVVHDCCCRLLRKAADYNLPRDGMRLLFKSITNACFTANTRARPILSLDTLTAGGLESRQLADKGASKPEELAMCKELEQAVGEGLAHLPHMQRAARCHLTSKARWAWSKRSRPTGQPGRCVGMKTAFRQSPWHLAATNLILGYQAGLHQAISNHLAGERWSPSGQPR